MTAEPVDPKEKAMEDAVAEITAVLGPLTPDQRGVVLDRVLFLARGGVRYDFTNGDFPRVTFHDPEIDVTPAGGAS